MKIELTKEELATLKRALYPYTDDYYTALEKATKEERLIMEKDAEQKMNLLYKVVELEKNQK